VAPRQTQPIRVIAAVGVAVALGLPLLHFLSAGQRASLARPLETAIRAATGELRLDSAPAGAEVYVDGTLRGLTPLSLKLGVGRHQLRVGSPRLERWRAAEVAISNGRSELRHIDLTE
jgi:hypothetical protein